MLAPITASTDNHLSNGVAMRFLGSEVYCHHLVAFRFAAGQTGQTFRLAFLLTASFRDAMR